MAATIGMYLLAGLMGAAVFSWLGLVGDRLPRRISLIHPPSHCACGRPLDRVALIPVCGWLIRGGRARCCGAHIAMRYPAMEALGGAIWMGCLALAGPVVLVILTIALIIIPLLFSALMR